MSPQTQPPGGLALVLFSGGQDSTTCLAWALDRFSTVETIGFDYGQRHAVELSARPRILARLRDEFPRWESRLGVDRVLSMNVMAEIGGSALLDSNTNARDTASNDWPPTFVPGRNILFLAAAAALAYRRGIAHLVGGMCETDYSGYPDCREETIKAVGRALELGMGRSFAIHTPLMRLDKKDTWSLAESLGGAGLLRLVIEETVTCYNGDREQRHEWGYGCGTCPACLLRARGYERYLGA